jgi:hypothetical protein
MIMDLITESYSLQFLLTCSALVVGAVKATRLSVDDKNETVDLMVQVAIDTGRIDPDDFEAIDSFRSKVSESIDAQYKTKGTRTTLEVDPALTRARQAFIDSLKSDGIEQIKSASGALQLGVYRMSDGVWDLGTTRHPRNEDGSKKRNKGYKVTD